MKRIYRKFKNLLASTVVIAVVVISTTAWATLTFVTPKDATVTVSHGTQTEGEAISAVETAKPPRSRAPEPSTMALFGSGIFGMIVSFVRRAYAATKRMFDIAAGIIGVILLSPLFLLTALWIKIVSRGPVVYKQVRVGLDGEEFTIYKFRTMKVDAEENTGPVWAMENDNRLIPGGNFLRKAHIDEIPQFFNILEGSMSLIGPRPERPIFVKKFKEEIGDYEKRLAVKPGLTGLAQVWHKYDETITDVKRKLKYDLLYIKRVCLWTDVRILLRTFRVVFTGEGAR